MAPGALITAGPQGRYHKVVPCPSTEAATKLELFLRLFVPIVRPSHGCIWRCVVSRRACHRCHSYF